MAWFGRGETLGRLVEEVRAVRVASGFGGQWFLMGSFAGRDCR
jgi:hypothetical protein